MAPPRKPLPDDERILELAEGCIAQHELAARLGIAQSTLSKVLRERGLTERVGQVMHAVPTADDGDGPDISAAVYGAINKRGEVRVDEVADALDVAPRRVREALDQLREAGYRIPDEAHGQVQLEKVAPTKNTIVQSLLDGDELEVGLVSDTHLGSKEEALEELEAAYSEFEARGITEVWHAGDWISGTGLFRTHSAEIKVGTVAGQIGYCVEHYPRRDGIVTRGISGNHDWGGDAAKAGLDPVVQIAAERDDIEHLGPVSAWVELPNGAYVHLLHGSGGMSYSVDYKALKLVDGYPPGRKPSVLCVGHWHVAGWTLRRNVHTIFPACFEWQSPFLSSKGLSPTVGFYTLQFRLAEDGSIVKFVPEFHQFHEGRRVAGA